MSIKLDVAMKSRIGKTIKHLRHEQGITQVQFSQAAGISLATIRNIEQGSPSFSRNILNKIAYALGFSTMDLILKGKRIEEELKRTGLTWEKVERLEKEGAIWSGKKIEPTKEEKEFFKDYDNFFKNLLRKADLLDREFIILDDDNNIGFQNFMSLAIKYDVKLPDGILPKSNKKK